MAAVLVHELAEGLELGARHARQLLGRELLREADGADDVSHQQSICRTLSSVDGNAPGCYRDAQSNFAHRSDILKNSNIPTPLIVRGPSKCREVQDQKHLPRVAVI